MIGRSTENIRPTDISCAFESVTTPMPILEEKHCCKRVNLGSLFFRALLVVLIALGLLVNKWVIVSLPLALCFIRISGPLMYDQESTDATAELGADQRTEYLSESTAYNETVWPYSENVSFGTALESGGRDIREDVSVVSDDSRGDASMVVVTIREDNTASL